MKTCIKALFAALLLIIPAASRADVEVDGQATLESVKLQGTTRIKINGQSQVSGGCRDEKAVITVWIDGGKTDKKPPSKLTIAGKCKKLIIERINGQTTVDASELEADEIEIQDMDGQTTVRCNTKGDILVKKIDGQSHVWFKKYSGVSPLIEVLDLNGQSTVMAE